MKGIAGLVILVLVLGGVAWLASPAFRGTVQKQYREHAGWNEEARRADPIGYINYAMEELKKDVDSLKSMQTQFAQARHKLDDELKDRKGKVMTATLYLDNFKRKYNEAKESGSFPVVVEDKPYTEQELIAQLKLILAEKKANEQVVTQMDSALKTQEEKRNLLAVRVTESQSKLSLLESQRVILQADRLSKAGEDILKNVNDVLVENENTEKNTSPIRTLDEIAKATAQANNNKTAVMDKEVEDFLKSGK